MKKARRPELGRRAEVEDPAMTDFRARGTIIGLAGLTAVFGMGTGGAPPVSSPESGRGAVKPLGRRWFRWLVTRAGKCRAWRWKNHPSDRGPYGCGVVDRILANRSISATLGLVPAAADRGGQAVGC